MKQAPNYHLIQVKYIGPTNYRSAMVRLTSARFKDSITVPWDDLHNSVLDLAQRTLEMIGYQVKGRAEWGAVDFIISDTFRSLKESKAAHREKFTGKRRR